MLMQLLMTIAILINIHAALELIVSTIFSDHLQKLLESYPNLTCSLLSKHGFELAGMVTFCIIGFKIFLTTHPMDYLEMNHERIMIIILCSIVILEIIDWCIILKFSGTFCVKQKVVELNNIHQIKIEKENFKVSLPVGAFLGLLLLIQEVVYISAKLWKGMKCRQTRKVGPMNFGISFKAHPTTTKPEDNAGKTDNLDNAEHVSLDMNNEEGDLSEVMKCCKPCKQNQPDLKDKDIAMNIDHGTSTSNIITVLEKEQDCEKNIEFENKKKFCIDIPSNHNIDNQESSNSKAVNPANEQNIVIKDDNIKNGNEVPLDKYISKQYSTNSAGKGE